MGTKQALQLLVMLQVGILAQIGWADDFGSGQSSTWSQWRGPERNGEFLGPQWPSSINDEHLRKQWSVELGESYSGPIIAEDRVFTTETVNEETEIIRALDRASGKEIWQTQWPGAIKVPFFAARNGSWIRSTPAYDGESLFVAGMADVLASIDAKSGSVKWRVDFCARYDLKAPDFGLVCSPLIQGDSLYIQAADSLMKIDKKTGMTVWRTLQGENGMFEGGAFSSPVLATIHGKETLVVQTRLSLVGVDPRDGTIQWQEPIPSYRGMNILTPLVFGDGIFTSNYRGKSWFYDVLSTDGGMRLEKKWEERAAAYMSTPVRINQHIYMHLQNKRINCIDLMSGKETWRTPDSYG